MSAKFFFRLRAATVDLGPFLGSWQLSVVLMVTAAFWYLLLAVFAFLSPTHVVQGIAGLAMFWLLYALILLNTGACIILRGLRRVAIGTLLFHLSLFLLAAGFLLTVLSRSEVTYRLAEGEELTGEPSQIAAMTPPRLLMTAQAAPRIRAEKIDAQLWRDELLFTRLEARLIDGRTTAINRPLLLGVASFLRLSGFGYAPRYEVLESSGTVVESQFVKLSIFPPGRRDFISSSRLPFRFYLSAEDLAATRLHVKVYRGRLLLAERTLGRGEPLQFEGLTFRIAEVRQWGEFTVVRDAGAPLLLIGAAIGIAGLAMRTWRTT